MNKLFQVITAASAAALMLASCATPSAEPASGGPTVADTKIDESVQRDEKIAARLPAVYAQKGEFVAAVNSGNPPIKFINDKGETDGLSPRLLKAAGKVLGINAVMVETKFDGLIPGLTSERFDVIASIGDFAERRENLDFIDYMTGGTGMLASAEFKHDEIASPDELCGARVAYLVGSVQQGWLEEAAAKCKSQGSSDLVMSSYQDNAATVLAVKSGQDDVSWIDSAAAKYNAAQEPETFKYIYSHPEPEPYGIGVLKTNSEFRDALRAALLKLVETGYYEKLLEEYGQETQALPKMLLNQGPPQKK